MLICQTNGLFMAKVFNSSNKKLSFCSLNSYLLSTKLLKPSIYLARKKMDLIARAVENIEKRWKEAILPKSNQKIGPNEKVINGCRLKLSNLEDIEHELYQTFLTSNNIYETHLGILKAAHKMKNMATFQLVLFINQTFVTWLNQQKNALKKANSSSQNKILLINEVYMKEAFNFVLDTNYFKILSSFNKIYNFKQNIDSIMDLIKSDRVAKLNKFDLAILVSELELYDEFDSKLVILFYYN
jgi:hypothetical protein